MKKPLILAGVLLIIFTTLVVIFLLRLKGQETTTQSTQLTSLATEVIIEDNPYVTLTPRADGHEFTLEVKNLKKTELVEYELSYLAGEFSRGAIGEIKVDGANSFTRKLLLGSESCSGGGESRVCKYRYDEGVQTGTLILRLRQGAQKQKLETPFHLQKGSEAKQGLTSGDGNFEFRGTVPSSAFYSVLSTVGVPVSPKGKIVGGPYGVFTSGSASAKGIIKLRLSEPAAQVKVLGWDGSSWREYTKDFKNEGGFVLVTTDRLTVFVVVAS